MYQFIAFISELKQSKYIVVEHTEPALRGKLTMAPARHGGPERFPTTVWSLVARAGREDAQQRCEALGQLLVRYLPALQAHLIYRRQFAPNDADDMIQEFVASKVVEKDLISQADRQLGKFRTFLLTALDRFAINQLRNQRAKKRAPEQGELVDIGDRSDWLSSGQGASHAFDTTWARGVIAEALRRMRDDCQSSGRAELWGVFECRVVGPIMEGAQPVDYQQLIERFGFRSPTQASNALITAKRMYVRALRSVVAEYARDNDEIEAEIDELREVLAKS